MNKHKNPDLNPCSRCGSKKKVTFGPDPYQAEINDDHTPYWMCEECRNQSLEDI
jgi:hypothetical protein